MSSVTLPVVPAEWHPQSAVLLTWPRPDGDFAALFGAVDRNFIRLARAIAAHTPLLIVAPPEDAQLGARLRHAGVDPARYTLVPAPSDDVWARDHGPITVFRDGRALHRDFRFNGWGGKFAAARDDRITAALETAGALPGARTPVDFELEGGAIDSDGNGTLLTTARCLLAPERNGTVTRAQVEAVLRDTLGAARVLWLEHGGLEGDDTDGHIDTLARFCAPDTIAFQSCENRDDPHYAPLQAMQRELEALRRADGAPYRLVPLPLPAAVHDADGRRLPAGYANFLISNGAVLMPTYGDAADAVALERLAAAFPRHRVTGVDCRALIHQYGSLHCVTMQLPTPFPGPSEP